MQCPECESKNYSGRSGQWGITWHCKDCAFKWVGGMVSASGHPTIQKLLLTDHELREEIKRSTENPPKVSSTPSFRNPEKNVSNK